jgi:transcriptional regulator of met regulon
MARIDFDLDDFTNAALKRLVKQLLVADDEEEKKIVKNLGKKTGAKSEKNDLADLHEEKHGKPNTPMVTDDDLEYDGDDELPDVPKQKGKKNG